MQRVSHRHAARLLQTHFNQSFLFASQAASAGCHRLKITISPPLSCLINNSDVQFRNLAINLLKYCWRMLIVVPVAIKSHLHNVCAKNNYELLIAQEPAWKRSERRRGSEGDVCKMGARECRWRDSAEAPCTKTKKNTFEEPCVQRPGSTGAEASISLARRHLAFQMKLIVKLSPPPPPFPSLSGLCSFRLCWWGNGGYLGAT